MLVGAHTILYSKQPEADRAFLRDVLKLPNVDAGEGWLIFGLPPGEIGVHPSEKNDVHEFYFMVDDVAAFAAEMSRRSIRCKPVVDQGYGLVTEIVLPGGGKLGVYEPRHARPKSMAAAGGGRRNGGRRGAKAKTATARGSTRGATSSKRAKAMQKKAGRR